MEYMNILIIAPREIPVPPVAGGSVEHCIYEIATHIPKEHQVTIVSRRHPRYPNRSVRGNVTILRVRAGTPRQYVAAALNRVQGMRFDWIQVDNRPNYIPWVKRRCANTPVSLFLHSTTFVLPPYGSRATIARYLAYADRIVGNSRSLQDKLIRLFPQSRHKIKYVYLGVDGRQFKLPTAEQKKRARMARNPGRSFTVVFAGRLVSTKGIPILMKAVSIARKQVGPIKLLIAGGAGKRSYLAYLKQLAASLHISASFVGNVPHSQMHRFYWSGDCFICPSQRHEAFGLVNVEAMASGLPCIASCNGGIPEVIRHNVSGLLVDNYRSPGAFAAQLVRIANNPALARKLAAQGHRDVMRRFSWRATSSKLVKLYQHANKR